MLEGWVISRAQKWSSFGERRSTGIRGPLGLTATARRSGSRSRPSRRTEPFRDQRRSLVAALAACMTKTRARKCRMSMEIARLSTKAAKRPGLAPTWRSMLGSASTGGRKTSDSRASASGFRQLSSMPHLPVDLADSAPGRVAEREPLTEIFTVDRCLYRSTGQGAHARASPWSR